MEEPPEADGGGNQDESDGLVAAEGIALGRAPLLLGDLLVMRLDAGFDQLAPHGPAARL